VSARVAHAELLRLDGRCAVVTGAARGLGRSIAERLAEAGAGIVLGDLDGDAAAAAASEIAERWSVPAIGLAADVVEVDDVERLGQAARDLRGRLDIWVNNAGIFPIANPVTATREAVERILGVNVVGTHLGCQVAVKNMDGGTGVIVNIASTAAFHGAGAYVASKWAVRGMTQGLASRLGPDGIRVVAVAPTAMDTPGVQTVRKSPKMATMYDELADRLPLRRLPSTDEVANAVLFLASDAAAMITGVVLPVDGGELTL
jgi:NAD(P)-dependent dehydrogenase (short-subunit alcohol dehydrogenase family)